MRLLEKPTMLSYLTISAGLILLSAAMSPAPAFSETTDQLVIFVQQGGSAVDTAFRKKTLPEILRLAEAMSVRVSVVDADRGVPQEIGITPLIVFQNYRGRSIYQGRYTTLERIRNFIRTSRFVPQMEAELVRTDIPVWRNGRAKIWAPVKIARIVGTPPAGYDHEAFVREARGAMEDGFSRFKTEGKISLGRTDRGFYMDLYPWRADDGTIFLSLAVYSQFHCKEPVFVMKKDPLTGVWKDRKRLFREAARILENAVADQVIETKSGDGFDPVKSSVAAVSWEAVGFPLPNAPKKPMESPAASGRIPREWRLVQPAPEDPPVIQFHFKAPLDHYRGEVTQYQGRFDLAEGRKLDGATGRITVDPRSVTMGDGSLNSVLMGTIFLDVQRYPEAGFTIKDVRSDGKPLAYGRMSLASVDGTFSLKGKETPLSVTMEIEPVLGADSQPRLLARGMFQVDLGVFGIEGADGPAPANQTLVFDLFLPFRPEKR